MTKESNEQTATFSEFAKVLRVKPGAITQLKADDRLILTEDGKRVRVEASLARIRETADPSKAAVAARHAAARHAGAQGVGDGDNREDGQARVDDGADSDYVASPGYQHWRERTERAKALAAERDNAVADGALLVAAEVTAAVAAAITILRTQLERLPSEVAPSLAATADENEVRAVLTEAVEHALDDLSRKFHELVRITA